MFRKCFCCLPHTDPSQTLFRTEEALHGQLLAERSGQITPEQFKEIKEVGGDPSRATLG